jgi:hypothetical protein
VREAYGSQHEWAYLINGFRLEDWSMGKKRSFANYMKMVGLNTNTKIVTTNEWCHKGEWPPEAKEYYYDKKDRK